MSPRTAPPTDHSALERQLEALEEAVRLGRDRIPEPVLDQVLSVVGRSGERRRLSAEHTVVGFFGATGSGKSSLFNAVSGVELARAAATRPTTSEPLAAVWGAEGSGPLLDWLEVSQRHQLEGVAPGVDPGTAWGKVQQDGGLILLDLPDFDSITTSHRTIVERLAGQVDVLVWVVDPQKYADAALHRDFLEPMASHQGVTLVVLNQVDRLAEQDVPRVISSLQQILAQDGLTEVDVLAASARTRTGVDRVREAIAQVASARHAATERMLSDVRSAATVLDRDLTEGSRERSVPGEVADVGTAEVRRLSAALAQASGAETVATAVGQSYRLEATARTGWPAVRWLAKVRRDPLRRLNLRREGSTDDPRLHRTSLPERSPAQRASVDGAIRSFAESAATGAPEAWRASIRRAARTHMDTLPDDLDQAISATDLQSGRGSWWWHVVNVLQWLALLAAVVGLGWLGVLAGAAYLQFQLPPAPQVEGFPIPTLLVVGGLLFGILLALLTAPLVRLGASQRASRARRRLRDSLGEVAERRVVEPVRRELDRYRAFRQAVGIARGRR